ncbi:MAG: 23S rRNA (pseudouridine(1915)-N(3))-methyltransferase RlmH [Bacteroidales bacterium]
MKCSVYVISKTDISYVQAGISDYCKRIERYIQFDYVEIKTPQNSKTIPQSEIKRKEGELLLSKITSKQKLCLLDENGTLYSSVNFARYIENKLFDNNIELCFVVGGAYGFSDEIYDKAHDKISLSPMTFSHQIVRLLFLEQLYRAFTIIKGEPYHHV